MIEEIIKKISKRQEPDMAAGVPSTGHSLKKQMNVVELQHNKRIERWNSLIAGRKLIENKVFGGELDTKGIKGKLEDQFIGLGKNLMNRDKFNEAFNNAILFMGKEAKYDLAFIKTDRYKEQRKEAICANPILGAILNKKDYELNVKNYIELQTALQWQEKKEEIGKERGKKMKDNEFGNTTEKDLDKLLELSPEFSEEKKEDADIDDETLPDVLTKFSLSKKSMPKKLTPEELREQIREEEEEIEKESDVIFSLHGKELPKTLRRAKDKRIEDERAEKLRESFLEAEKAKDEADFIGQQAGDKLLEEALKITHQTDVGFEEQDSGGKGAGWTQKDDNLFIHGQGTNSEEEMRKILEISRKLANSHSDNPDDSFHISNVFGPDSNIDDEAEEIKKEDQRKLRGGAGGHSKINPEEPFDLNWGDEDL